MQVAGLNHFIFTRQILLRGQDRLAEVIETARRLAEPRGAYQNRPAAAAPATNPWRALAARQPAPAPSGGRDLGDDDFRYAPARAPRRAGRMTTL
mgnify:CR=1 FL=1